jgi:hypothetical protein
MNNSSNATGRLPSDSACYRAPRGREEAVARAIPEETARRDRPPPVWRLNPARNPALATSAFRFGPNGQPPEISHSASGLPRAQVGACASPPTVTPPQALVTLEGNRVAVSPAGPDEIASRIASASGHVAAPERAQVPIEHCSTSANSGQELSLGGFVNRRQPSCESVPQFKFLGYSAKRSLSRSGTPSARASR